MRGLSLKSFVSAVALIAGCSGMASAADFPVKAPPRAPDWSWNGLYIGAHGGGAFGTIETVGAGFPIASAAVNGAFGGGQIGYNFQTGPVVLGVEVDASGSGLRGTTPCIVVLSCERKVEWFGTATGRVGFTADRALIYVKAGGAWANFKYDTSAAGVQIATADVDKWGWVLGTGVEYAFLPHWSAKIEYNFMDFGKDSVAFNLAGGGIGLGGAALNLDSQQFVHTIKFGVNYRFGGPLMSY
jgi:outer membrane immunogenic protein